MASPVSKNVAAAVGLVPTVLDGFRRLPGKAVQLPVIAVGTALSKIDAARREYDDLADRGEKLIARLRGTSFDEVEDTLEDAATAVGRAVTKLNGASTHNAKQAVKAGTERAADRAEANKSVQETLPVAETAKPAPPKSEPAVTRHDSAASVEVIEQVEKIAENVAAPQITDHSELPLPDYDHMTLGSLRGRLRSLDMQQLVQLRDYEKSKADRLPVVTMLDNRIAKLSTGESVPTGSAPITPDPVTKAPKKVGEPAGAKNDSPPHTKVRTT